MTKKKKFDSERMIIYYVIFMTILTVVHIGMKIESVAKAVDRNTEAVNNCMNVLR